MPNTKRTKAGHGFWQVTGTGDLRHTVLGTVEKVYGGWFAVAQDGAERSCDTLSDGQEWLHEQYGRYAARIVTLQPTAHVDLVTEDGNGTWSYRGWTFHRVAFGNGFAIHGPNSTGRRARKIVNGWNDAVRYINERTDRPSAGPRS